MHRREIAIAHNGMVPRGELVDDDSMWRNAERASGLVPAEDLLRAGPGYARSPGGSNALDGVGL